MTDILHFSDMTPIQEMQGDDQEDTKLLLEMSQKADDYITSFRWCPTIREKYFGFGVGGIVAVFLYHFDSMINQSDDWLWVIVGDLPSVYLVIDNTTSPIDALEGYYELMEDWANNIMSDNSIDECYPVQAAPTKENAQMLLSRIEFIRREFIDEDGCASSED